VFQDEGAMYHSNSLVSRVPMPVHMEVFETPKQEFRLRGAFVEY
jgi:hypothetical protein